MFGGGFLGGNAPFGAHLNLLAQIAVAVLLLFGAWLARRGRYRAHGACQTLAFAATVTLTAIWMAPGLHEIFLPGLARDGATRINLAIVAHVTLGTATLLLGGWVILVAGTSLIPKRLRFANYTRWMRTLLVLWWTTAALGVLAYSFAW